MDKKKMMLELYKKYKDLFTDEFFKQHGFKILKYSYHTLCSRCGRRAEFYITNKEKFEKWAVEQHGSIVNVIKELYVLLGNFVFKQGSRVVECSYEALVNTYHAERFAIANYRLKKGLSYLIKNRRNKKRYKIASRQK